MNIDELQEELIDENKFGINESSINPDNWAFYAVYKSIEVLGAQGDLKQNFLKYITLVNQAEAICKGQSRLDKEYNISLEEFKKSEDYKNLSSHEKDIKLCTYKMELISKNLTSHSTITDPMKLGKM